MVQPSITASYGTFTYNTIFFMLFRSFQKKKKTEKKVLKTDRVKRVSITKLTLFLFSDPNTQRNFRRVVLFSLASLVLLSKETFSHTDTFVDLNFEVGA